MKSKTLKITTASAMSLLVVLTGCSGASKEPAQGGTTTPSASTAVSATPAAPAKPIDIKWMGTYIPGTDTMAQKYLEQKFNVKFTTVGVDRVNWEQQMNVKLAAGEKPDFYGMIDARVDTFSRLVTQGLLGEIPIETIRKFAPKYSKMIDDADKTAFDIGVINGKNYGIPKVYTEGGSPFIPAYNEAWLKKVGYNEPPKTLAELEDVLTKFRNNDPDGNGKKDTYGITARGKDTLGSNQIFNTVFAAHGVTPSGWIVQPDGKAQYGPVTEQSRTAFKLLNKWYKAGIIDPEFITDDWNSYRAKFANGKVGMLDQALWYHDHSSGQVGQDAEKAGMKLVIGTPVVGPAGKMMGIVQGFKQPPYGIGVEASKDPKKVEKILTILETIATNEEAYLMTSFGEKGKHFDIVDGGVVQKPEYTDPIKAASALGVGFFNPTRNNPLMVNLDYPSEKLALRTKINSIPFSPIADALQMRILPSWDTNKDAMLKMLKEYQLKFIVGEVDLDKGFDDFVAAMNKAGLEKATVEANEIVATQKK
ncbi:Lipoprotein LipO precursor [compost metagenome]